MEENLFTGVKKEKEAVLVVRADRIGDLTLSTPVFKAIQVGMPGSMVSALVHTDMLPVVRHNPHLTEVLTYDPKAAHKGVAGFYRLVRQLRSKRYDTVVHLQMQFKLAAACYFAGIKTRIGPYSKLYSYVFLNNGMKQKRSRVEMHEADYNQMLLRRMGIRVPSRQYDPVVVVDDQAAARIKKWLSDSLGERKFIVVHPGMRGSALNWPEGYYIDLVAKLAARGHNVVIGGTITETTLLERVKDGALKELTTLGHKEVPGVITVYSSPHSHTGLDDYIALLSYAGVVVAPSTGPLHLAAALGRSTVSFYPPIKVQSALRWGPYVADESKHSVFVPDALCGRDFDCAGKKCPFYFCMERLSVDDAVDQAELHLDKASMENR